MTDPNSSVLSWTVLRVEPPLVFEHTYEEAGSVVRWELQHDGDGCRLILTQTGSSRAIAVERHHLSGLHMSLERLSHALDGRPVEWSWPRWEEHRDRYAAKR